MVTATQPGTMPSINIDNLNMVRSEISLPDFYQWMHIRELVDPDHGMHCLLKECFGDTAPKPFRVIADKGKRFGVLYGYGQSSVEEMKDMAAMCADPLQSRIFPPERIHGKPVPANWPEGKRLGFDIRVRPIKRLIKDQEKIEEMEERLGYTRHLWPGSECDVYMVEMAHSRGMEIPPRARHQVYAEWLSHQFDMIGGARLEANNVRLHAFQITAAVRKLHARSSRGPDVEMRGNFIITDPDRFMYMLARGVGRHRAYGYGMLMVKPPSKLMMHN